MPMCIKHHRSRICKEDGNLQLLQEGNCRHVRTNACSDYSTQEMLVSVQYACKIGVPVLLQQPVMGKA